MLNMKFFALIFGDWTHHYIRPACSTLIHQSLDVTSNDLNVHQSEIVEDNDTLDFRQTDNNFFKRRLLPEEQERDDSVFRRSAVLFHR